MNHPGSVGIKGRKIAVLVADGVDAASVDKLVKALEALSQKKRDVIVLGFYYDLSAVEIAKRLNLSYENVCTIKSRALKELRKLLETPCKTTCHCDNTYLYGN
jgi:DNA-directed RNA polymerase specialized sigma subunit